MCSKDGRFQTKNIFKLLISPRVRIFSKGAKGSRKYCRLITGFFRMTDPEQPNSAHRRSDVFNNCDKRRA